MIDINTQTNKNNEWKFSKSTALAISKHYSLGKDATKGRYERKNYVISLSLVNKWFSLVVLNGMSTQKKKKKPPKNSNWSNPKIEFQPNPI